MNLRFDGGMGPGTLGFARTFQTRKHTDKLALVHGTRSFECVRPLAGIEKRMAKRQNTSTTKRSSRKAVRVLFTCVGRRVELVKAFRAAGDKLGLRLEAHGADLNMLAPAMHLVDHAHVVPPIRSGDYVAALVDVVQRCKIDLLIPLLDPELLPLSQSVARFADHGCLALVSDESVIRTCQDKLATYRALRAAGIDTPKTWNWEAIQKLKRHRFPYYMKPREGSASKGNFVIHNVRELQTLGRRVAEPIVQEFVDGAEHTLDVYTGFDGRPRCAVPRKRLEVRVGEVSKGVIVKDKAIMAAGCEVARMLGGCRGVVTVQCIVTSRGRIRVIEINPRFGGGAPLAIHAGADFPLWILTEWMGRKPRISANCFKDDVAMLRFDDSVFVLNASKLPLSD